MPLCMSSSNAAVMPAVEVNILLRPEQCELFADPSNVGVTHIDLELGKERDDLFSDRSDFTACGVKYL